MDNEGEEPYENDIVEGALVEVDEEPSIPDAQMRPPPITPKKKGRKKTFLIAAIIFLIIVFSLIGYILIPRPPSGLDLHVSEDNSGHSLRLNALISSDSATESSGTAKVSITYGGVETYSNTNWKINSNNDMIRIPYSDFVVGNGIYTVEAEFEGVKDTTTHEINFVIEDADITVHNVNLNDFTEVASFTLQANFETENNADPKNAEIKVAGIEHENGVDKVTTGIGTWEALTEQPFLQYDGTFNYDESGNYTITLEIRNNDVKSTSDNYKIDVEAQWLINAYPKAEIEHDDDNGVVPAGTTVTFDAYNTLDDGDNIADPEGYEWFFQDTQSYEYGIEVEHQFNTLSNPADSDDAWAVTLTVTDDGELSDFTSVGIRVTL